jgi:hypothetical protein
MIPRTRCATRRARRFERPVFHIGVLAMFSCLGCGMTERQLVGEQLARGGSAAGGAFAGSGGSAGAMGSGAKESAGGTGSAPSGTPSCLFPNPLVVPLTGKADVSDYVLSSPFAIEAPADRWGGLGGVLDVNGDWVSDLIFRDAAASRYRLLVSSPAPDVLNLKETSCEALDELPVGRMFLRDLDADGVADFVIGLEGGVVAFLNRPEGLEQVLDFRFAGATERAELISLDTIDLNGDDRQDLVVGYDRLKSEASLMFDTGALSFVQGADRQFIAGGSVTSNWTAASTEEPYGFAGYFAAGHFRRSGAPSVIVPGYEHESDQSIAVETDLAPGSAPKKVLIADPPEAVHEVFALPHTDGLDLLAVVGNAVFHVMDLRDGAPSELYSVALAYPGGQSHELGGGAESPRYYFFDIDSDGDKDFLERSRELPRELTLHVNLANAAFAAPQVLAAGTASSAEAPFVNVGPVRGVIDEVYDGAVPGDYRGTPTIYTLVSSSAGAK